MTVDQIKYFMEIVKAGSMSKAAEQLFISQPTLSLTIKHLENEIGYKLFIRSSKGVELTGKGAEFLNYAETILTNINNIIELKSSKTFKPLSISISSHFFSATVIPIKNLIKNHFRNNNYEIKLIQKSVFSIIDDVINGNSKIGILSISTLQSNLMNEKLLAEGLEFIEIMTFGVAISVTLEHPLAERESLSVKDLLEYPLILFEYSEKEFFAAKALKDMGVEEFPQKIIVSDMLQAFHLMNTVDGITFSMDDGIHNLYPLWDMYGLKLKSIPFDPSITMQMGYIKKINTELNHFEQQFIEGFIDIHKGTL